MIPISALFEGHCLLSWAARHRTRSAGGPATSCHAELNLVGNIAAQPQTRPA
jgi:hypothetical protein